MIYFDLFKSSVCYVLNSYLLTYVSPGIFQTGINLYFLRVKYRISLPLLFLYDIICKDIGEMTDDFLYWT